MDLGIRGKRALVLGASRGLGRAIAERLAEEGCNVIVGARDGEALKSLADELANAHGIEAGTISIDMSDADAVAALAVRIENELELDILVNNAGGPPPSGALGVDEDVWRTAAQSLIFSVIALTEAAVAGMRARGWGRILTIASSGVEMPIHNLAVSNTLRPAIAGFSKSLANEVARDGVTVNLILPGRIATDRTKTINAARAKRLGISEEESLAKSAAEIPVGRHGTPDEFAAVAAFLVSDQASYVNGHMMRVDGGLIRSV
ncbi:MAG: SDR family oxidoreductase [Rhizobiales bacterium]|nr:SDR family oxidoreductase [Hyphomicrobiales bacterium]